MGGAWGGYVIFQSPRFSLSQVLPAMLGGWLCAYVHLYPLEPGIQAQNHQVGLTEKPERDKNIPEQKGKHIPVSSSRPQGRHKPQV